MEDQNTLVAVTLLLVLSDFVIFMAHGKLFPRQTSFDDEYVSVLKWKHVEDPSLNRFRRNIDRDRWVRDTSTSGSKDVDNSGLITTKFLIPDKSHDQAVVSWSGINNTVSISLFWILS